jgi:hypothetical protein
MYATLRVLKLVVTELGFEKPKLKSRKNILEVTRIPTAHANRDKCVMKGLDDTASRMGMSLKHTMTIPKLTSDRSTMPSARTHT